MATTVSCGAREAAGSLIGGREHWFSCPVLSLGSLDGSTWICSSRGIMVPSIPVNVHLKQKRRRWGNLYNIHFVSIGGMEALRGDMIAVEREFRCHGDTHSPWVEQRSALWGGGRIHSLSILALSSPLLNLFPSPASHSTLS